MTREEREKALEELGFSADMSHVVWSRIIKDGREQYTTKITLVYKDLRYTTDYFVGSAVNRKEISVLDIVWSLYLDGQAGAQTYQEFYNEFGYDADDHETKRIYKACKNVYKEFWYRVSGDTKRTLEQILEDW